MRLRMVEAVPAGDGSRRLAQPTVEDLLPPAPQDELEGMIAHFERLLEPRGYFRPPSRAAATRRTLRTMLTKPGWNHLEVRTLRGVLSALEQAAARATERRSATQVAWLSSMTLGRSGIEQHRLRKSDAYER